MVERPHTYDAGFSTPPGYSTESKDSSHCSTAGGARVQ